MGTEPQAFLLETDRPEEVVAVRHALTAAGIPYQTGLKAESPPWVIFFVPYLRLHAAQQIATGLVSSPLEPDASAFDDDGNADDDESGRPIPAALQQFPWGPLQAVAALAMGHLALVFGSALWQRSGFDLLARGGIVHEATRTEPWRLLTSLFIHVDPAHVMWNAVSMMVFAVPLIGYLGYARTAGIYTAAGLGGALTAWVLSNPGSTIVGSSGAVAGLFGAWIVWTLRQAPRGGLGWRARIRTLGIALLVLPSLITPTTANGDPISVSSHLGGLITGMLIGAVLSGSLIRRTAPPLRPL